MDSNNIRLIVPFRAGRGRTESSFTGADKGAFRREVHQYELGGQQSRHMPSFCGLDKQENTTTAKQTQKAIKHNETLMQ